MTPQEIQAIKQRFSIVGTDSQLNRAIEIAVQVAATDLSVLVRGESGVGKEFFPQIIHANSRRKHMPYFAVNCGAIPTGTINSELFGHEKGAFTDAKNERQGYFEIANGGTLFLDEIGELPLATQALLLRVLEAGEFIRVGSNQVQKTDVRIVAATNVDLRKAIQEGKFREDLYYRLNAIEIAIPPLRERKDDIPLLFRKFVSDFAERNHMPPIHLTEEAYQLLKNYYWNGNVRQVKNVAEQLCVIEKNREISASTLRLYLPANETVSGLRLVHNPSSNDSFMNERELLYKVLFEMKKDINDLKNQLQQLQQIPVKNHTETVGNQEDIPLAEEVKEDATWVKTIEQRDSQPTEPESIDQIEKEAIRQALRKFDGNRRLTAESLKLSERTLYRKIREYGL